MEREPNRREPTRYRRAAYRAALLFACALPVTLLTPVSAQDDGGRAKWFANRNREDSDKKGRGQRGFREPTREMRERVRKLPEAERKGIELVQRMFTAGMKKAFIAREVTIRPGGPEIEQWVRWDPKRGMRRESVQAGGPIFMDNLEKSYHFDPRENRWYVRNSMLPRPEGRIGSTLYQLYEGGLKAEVTGEDVVAGRKAHIVSVTPPPGSKGPSRRFWIDRKTGMRLKNEEVGPQGRVFASSYYISIDLNPSFRPEDFTPPANAVPAPDWRMDRRVFKDIAEANRAGVSPRLPSYLPTGFTLRVIEEAEFGRRGKEDKREGNEGQRKTMITVRYGNGITVISLVQSHVRMLPPSLKEQLGNEEAAFIPLPNGGPDRMYVWRDGDRGYMLIAPLSEAEMKRIANSVR